MIERGWITKSETLLHLLNFQGKIMNSDIARTSVPTGPFQERFEDLKHSLGGILRRLELIDEKSLARALRLSELTGMRLGRALVLMSCIDPELLKAVLEAQMLIRLDVCSYRDIAQALSIVRRKGWSLVDALLSLGLDASPLKKTRLGELLVTLGSIDQSVLEFGLYLSDQTGIPLGKIMIMLGVTSLVELELILAKQLEIRKGKVERDEAMEQLRSEIGSPELSGRQEYERLSAVRPMDLLAGVSLLDGVSKADCDNVMDWERSLGDTDKERGRRLLILSIALAENIWRGDFRVEEATEALAKAFDLDTRFGMSADRHLTFFEFLKLSGYLSRERIKDMILSELDQIGSEMDYRKRIKQNFADDSRLFELLVQLEPEENFEFLKCCYVIHSLYLENLFSLDQAYVQSFIRKGMLGRAA